MSAFWTSVAATGGLILLLITLTEKGHAFTRWLRGTVKFWWTLKKHAEKLEERVKELEGPPKPRNWEQQHCTLCGKRGQPVDGRGSFRDGHWTVWFMCDDCKPIWPVRMD